VDEQLVNFHSVLLGTVITNESPVRATHKRAARIAIPEEVLVVGVGIGEEETVVGAGVEKNAGRELRPLTNMMIATRDIDSYEA